MLNRPVKSWKVRSLGLLGKRFSLERERHSSQSFDLKVPSDLFEELKDLA